MLTWVARVNVLTGYSSSPVGVSRRSDVTTHNGRVTEKVRGSTSTVLQEEKNLRVVGEEEGQSRPLERSKK